MKTETGIRVSLVMARTLDGRTARSLNDPLDWTEAADKAHFSALTRRMGLVLMGSKTFDAMGGPLPGRKNVVFTRFPESRVSVSGDLAFTSGSVDAVLDGLAAEGYGEAALIGGSRLNTAFAKAGRIHELFVTVSPLIFGAGPGLFSEHIPMDLLLVNAEPLGFGSLLLHYRVRHGGCHDA
ncbi:dihydrofolate reductase [Desulfobotulus alkaliphilus]|uniref:Dihydrofolate reductase n=1 Tax=Desulfobotulus alkaliphilus TaxID=622671 RepID=A0A562RMM6_9BACT|nr:dihydrofolate reductase family protein [Desulfobotulus alkaliphilus]TWI70297.1 dihydrofolate reductase [Desulfobotulus alkaliphilus]